MAMQMLENTLWLEITTLVSVVVKRIVDWKFTTLNLEVMVELMMKKILLLYVRSAMTEFMLAL